MARSINDRLNSNSESWRGEPGDMLSGSVIGLSSNDGGFGVYKVVTVEITEEGSTEQGGKPIPVGDERSFHAFHTVAANTIADSGISVGYLFGVKYHGKREGRDGNEFHSYRIVIERQQTPVVTEPAEPVATGAGDGAADAIPFQPV